MLDHPRIELTMVSHRGRELDWQDYSKRLYKKMDFPYVGLFVKMDY